ncbi:hypothetical protein AALA44_09510 [Enterococcus ratti]|uniref:hypothetical protein n=1 Tax=Enterococcus ratti TaxID=150033 RepID=UPI0035193229
MVAWYEGAGYTFGPKEIENQKKIVNQAYENIEKSIKRDWSNPSKASEKAYKQELKYLKYMQKNPLSINGTPFSMEEIQKQERIVSMCHDKQQANVGSSERLKKYFAEKAKLNHMKSYNEDLHLCHVKKDNPQIYNNTIEIKEEIAKLEKNSKNIKGMHMKYEYSLKHAKETLLELNKSENDLKTAQDGIEDCKEKLGKVKEQLMEIKKQKKGSIFKKIANYINGNTKKLKKNQKPLEKEQKALLAGLASWRSIKFLSANDIKDYKEKCEEHKQSLQNILAGESKEIITNSLTKISKLENALEQGKVKEFNEMSGPLKQFVQKEIEPYTQKLKELKGNFETDLANIKSIKVEAKNRLDEVKEQIPKTDFKAKTSRAVEKVNEKLNSKEQKEKGSKQRFQLEKD